MNPNQALEKIREALIENGRDTRYTLGAYAFVMNGLEFFLAKLGEKRHVSGQELSAGLAEFAKKQFGPLALEVLNSYGIHATDDWGNIVYNLIDTGLMCRQDNDSLDDFRQVFDLKEYFGAYDPYQIDKEFIRSVKGA